ncbi:MAG: type VI secretion system membrane subunit TssM [Rubrivivax sp.]|nr:type VI secretion system membrane subunit TssM [Rubrivivax sp.]
MKRFLRWMLSPVVIGTLGLLALSALIWWIGPLIGIAGAHPLDPLWVRITLLVLIWVGWIARLAWVAWRRRRTNAALLAGMAGGPTASDKEAQVLAQRFNEAVQRLKAGGAGNRSLLGGGQYLYELPWYIFVGAPGSGKTTALMNAGLQFLLGEGAGKGSVQGVGGTRNCEWWFTQDAVLIDTAGRYATQESDRDVDASAWDNFLALLKRTRPRQPLNGVLLTVNVQDLLQQGVTERQEHASKLRARLLELHTKLGVRAPVYVLVTKADLIGGFNESFEALNKDERDQVWGFTFAAPNGPGEDPMREFGALYQQLQKRLVEQLVDRMESERDVLRRSAMFAFPQEFAALQGVLGDFLGQVFSGGGKVEAVPLVRGVYFTSGTQEGSPIDRVMGALGRSFGIDPRSAAIAGGRGKSFFLHRLLKGVVFAEAGLGSINPGAETRHRVLRTATFAALAVLGTAMLVGWAVSRARNLDHAAIVAERLPALKQSVEALPAPTSADVAALPLPLAQVRDAARIEGFELPDPPLLNGLGLYQGEKLDAAAQLAYTQLLEKALMPRVARRLEERVRAATKDNLENAYEALKSYVMLHTPDEFDAPTLKAWIGLDWDANYSRMAPEQRVALDAHLDAMLALGPPRAALPIDTKLVAEVREMLAAYPLEYRVYSRVKRQYRSGDMNDFTVAGGGGPDAAQVFERASGKPLTQGVSGLYTKDGHQKFVLPALKKAVGQLAREDVWVLGLKQDPVRLKDALPNNALTDKARRLYYEDYIKTWEAFLADVRLVKLAGLERSITVARIVAAADSPLARYLRAVTEQTRLVPPPTAPGVLDKLADKAKQDAAKLAGSAPVAGAGSGGPLERMVDDRFAAIHRQVSGQPAPIDETLKLFNEVYVQLSAVKAAQDSKSPPPAGGAAAAVKSAAGQQPEPVRSMLEQLADAGASQSRDAERQGLTADLKPITDFCNRAISGRYPFASGSRADVLPEDFGQLFGGGGLFDDFFQKRLANLVDTSSDNWAFKPLSDGSRPVAPAALAEFQRAARIREVFFRSGGKVPALRIEMRVTELDPSLKELLLDVDGQAQRMSSGGASISLNWPSVRLASQIKLSTGLGNAGPLVMFEGPWALFRLFDRFEVQPSAVPEKFSVVMNLDGKRARVEVIAASVFNPFQMKEVKQFRCPAGL